MSIQLIDKEWFLFTEISLRKQKGSSLTRCNVEFRSVIFYANKLVHSGLFRDTTS